MADPPETLDLEPSVVDFEFCLEDPSTMLPADELFSDGKLMPLQLSAVEALTWSEARSPENVKSRRKPEISCRDPYLFSPKAPRCSSRWRELLGLKKLSQSTNLKNGTYKPTSSSSSNPYPKSLKLFLHKSSKSSSDASLSCPLLKDSDCESVSMSSRLSLFSSSSSSSGHEHEDLPRLFLDSDKPNPNPNPFVKNPNPRRMRIVKPGADNPTATRIERSPMRRAPEESGAATTRGVSVDSPRINSSGKIVFQSLERSSSSPSSFNGGPRLKHRDRGMERSYSANVRVTPVLNVPVRSLRGSSKPASVFAFGQLFSSLQKREGYSTRRSGRSQQSNRRNRTDRT